MPVIRLTASKYYIFFTSSIAFNGEIISLCFYYTKKGLVCITIIKPFSYQPSFCSKCIKSNTCILYNMRSVPFNKYAFLAYFDSY